VPVPDPDPVAVGEFVGVGERDAVVELVPESVPVLEMLASEVPLLLSEAARGAGDVDEGGVPDETPSVDVGVGAARAVCENTPEEEMLGARDAVAENEALPLPLGEAAVVVDVEPHSVAKTEVCADSEADPETADAAELDTETEIDDDAERRAVADPLLHTDIEPEAGWVARGETELLPLCDAEGRGDDVGDGRAVGVGMMRLISAAVTVAGVLPDQITSPVLATRSSTRRFADLLV
jgi:hypothetical protein